MTDAELLMHLINCLDSIIEQQTRDDNDLRPLEPAQSQKAKAAYIKVTGTNPWL